MTRSSLITRCPSFQGPRAVCLCLGRSAPRASDVTLACRRSASAPRRPTHGSSCAVPKTAAAVLGLQALYLADPFFYHGEKHSACCDPSTDPCSSSARRVGTHPTRAETRHRRAPLPTATSDPHCQHPLSFKFELGLRPSRSTPAPRNANGALRTLTQRTEPRSCPRPPTPPRSPGSLLFESPLAISLFHSLVFRPHSTSCIPRSTQHTACPTQSWSLSHRRSQQRQSPSSGLSSAQSSLFCGRWSECLSLKFGGCGDGEGKRRGGTAATCAQRR